MPKDKRGIIKDLMVGKCWSITYITFKKGAVRGNHYHKKTLQIDIVISGKLKGKYGMMLKRGNLAFQYPKNPHAYKALKDSEMVSICFGKRIGKNYSKDTYPYKINL